MFHVLLLKSYKQINNQRSYSSIFHLLTGKRSAQTIQDAKVFQLESFFGIYPSLTRSAFHQELAYLKKQNYIAVHQQNTIQVTERGISFLHNEEKKWIGLQWLNGYEYYQSAPIFWKRLLLVIQTISNLLNKRNQFLPIVEDNEILSWVKKYYFFKKREMPELFCHLYEELIKILSDLPDSYANVMVDQITSFRYVGLSKEQIADKINISKHDVEMLTQSSLHYLLSQIHSKKHSLLNELIPIITKKDQLTNSAQKTWEYLSRGMSIDEIAQIRHLKISTIKDHIIEMAIRIPHFPIHRFVEKEKEQLIADTIEKINSKRLKQIKEKLPDSIDYFTIRLVLAKLAKNEGGMNDERP
jgi:uncharacterized protein YpbB